jgi:hypothetical protein
MIPKNSIILFQGDSITDCGRNREAAGTPNDLCGLGQGYAMMAAAELLSTRPTDGLRVFNRGISGNRVVDLDSRIKNDIIHLKPDVLSILIGVNDTWHGKTSDNGVTVPKYERVYRALLDEVREARPSVKFVLCEPFVLRCGVVRDDWVEEIDERRAVVAKLAKEFGAVLVQFQSMFDAAVKSGPPEYWASDGVHPTAAGHLLMAKCWLEKTTLL